MNNSDYFFNIFLLNYLDELTSDSGFLKADSGRGGYWMFGASG
jgi:hypothetical protein